MTRVAITMPACAASVPPQTPGTHGPLPDVSSFRVSLCWLLREFWSNCWTGYFFQFRYCFDLIDSKFLALGQLERTNLTSIRTSYIKNQKPFNPKLLQFFSSSHFKYSSFSSFGPPISPPVHWPSSPVGAQQHGAAPPGASPESCRGGGSSRSPRRALEDRRELLIVVTKKK